MFVLRVFKFRIFVLSTSFFFKKPECEQTEMKGGTGRESKRGAGVKKMMREDNVVAVGAYACGRVCVG